MEVEENLYFPNIRKSKIFYAPKTKHSKTSGFRCVKIENFDSFRGPQIEASKTKFCVPKNQKFLIF